MDQRHYENRWKTVNGEGKKNFFLEIYGEAYVQQRTSLGLYYDDDD